jgi:hypothetical protein
MPVFTIIGIWTDTDQRFATHIEAKNSIEAEAICSKHNEGLTICGVIQGCHEVLDYEPHVRSSLFQYS